MITDHITQYVHEINKITVRKKNKANKIVFVYVYMIQIVNMNVEHYKKHRNFMKHEFISAFNFNKYTKVTIIFYHYIS